MRWRSRKSLTVDEENPYWMSFSDIMAALLVIFILAAVVLILQLTQRQRQFDERVFMLERAEQVRRSILDEALEELRARGIQAEISENHTALRIPNELLGFETAEFTIDAQYQETALEIGTVISEVIRKDNRMDYLDTVFVEGHTDSRDYQGLMGMGNWGLSTFRAISLWQYWLGALPDQHRLDRLENPDDSKLFSVSGYAATRELVDAAVTEAEHQMNRRIDIRFTIRRPTTEEYEIIRQSVQGTAQ